MPIQRRDVYEFAPGQLPLFIRPVVTETCTIVSEDEDLTIRIHVDDVAVWTERLAGLLLDEPKRPPGDVAAMSSFPSAGARAERRGSPSDRAATKASPSPRETTPGVRRPGTERRLRTPRPGPPALAADKAMT